MADRTLRVNIIGDERDLLRAFGSSARGSRQFQAQMTGASRSLRNVFAAAGVALGATAIVQAFRSTISAAIDFESSFAGVRKTVDATEPQLQALARGFRELSKDIPVSVNELNRIGEAAGQLGIQRTAILDFTATIAALGATTNLSADQAADALARIANIVQLPQDQFDELGSTVADLGNKLAATESEIVDFGSRIAAAGKIVGLSVDEVLAISGAFASVNVEAERGGTAVSKVFISLANAVKSGGKQLELFAKTAGTSTAEFRRQFETDASAAFVAFVEGLKRVDDEGGNVFKTLKDLGLTDARLIQAFLSISQSGDLLNRSLAVGSRAWKENSALQIEAAKRYATTASKLQLFQNRVNDLQITLGNVLAPALLEIITPLGKWLESTENQERVQRALIDVMKDARSIFEGVRDVVQPLAEATKTLADRMGGLREAVKLLLAVMVASKIVGFGTALTGLGTAAGTTTTKVNLLRTALFRLGAIGVITLSIEFLTNYDKISAQFQRLTGLGAEILPKEPIERLERLREKLTKTAFLFGQNSEQARKLSDQIAALNKQLGLNPSVASLHDERPTGQRSNLDAAKGKVVDAAEVDAKRSVLNFKKLLNRLDLELETALGTSSLGDDVAVLRKIEAAIVGKIAQEGKTFKLSKELIETRNKISQALATQAEQAKQKAQDAFSALLAGLNLNLGRAGATTSFQDDIKALQAIENAIKDRIQVEGRTTDLLSQLFQVQQDQAGIAQQIRERAAERKQGVQFEALGLTSEGDKRAPGAGALRGRAATLEAQIKGTILDTPKTRQKLENIGKLLSGAYGKLGKDVRNAILGMLNDIAGGLDDKKGPLTKTSGLNSKKILEGLGLSPEEIRGLRGRLSGINSAGFQLAGTAGAGSTFGRPDRESGFFIENNVTVAIDGQKFSAVVTKQQQKTRRRNPKQKRGPNRMTGGV